jgi:hypothetical protein
VACGCSLVGSRFFFAAHLIPTLPKLRVRLVGRIGSERQRWLAIREICIRRYHLVTVRDCALACRRDQSNVLAEHTFGIARRRSFPFQPSGCEHVGWDVQLHEQLGGIDGDGITVFGPICDGSPNQR